MPGITNFPAHNSDRLPRCGHGLPPEKNRKSPANPIPDRIYRQRNPSGKEDANKKHKKYIPVYTSYQKYVYICKD